MFTSTSLSLQATTPLFSSSPFRRKSLNISVSPTAATGRTCSASASASCQANATSFSDLQNQSSKHACSLYDILRVKHNASLKEIKTAYRALAKMYHPDAQREETDEREFIEIHNAYATLSDPMARALYDLTLGTRKKVGVIRCRSRNNSGFYQTRRWETDQCW